jgi:hypothetical protein
MAQYTTQTLLPADLVLPPARPPCAADAPCVAAAGCAPAPPAIPAPRCRRLPRHRPLPPSHAPPRQPPPPTRALATTPSLAPAGPAPTQAPVRRPPGRPACLLAPAPRHGPCCLFFSRSQQAPVPPAFQITGRGPAPPAYQPPAPLRAGPSQAPAQVSYLHPHRWPKNPVLHLPVVCSQALFVLPPSERHFATRGGGPLVPRLNNFPSGVVPGRRRPRSEMVLVLMQKSIWFARTAALRKEVDGKSSHSS